MCLSLTNTAESLGLFLLLKKYFCVFCDSVVVDVISLSFSDFSIILDVADSSGSIDLEFLDSFRRMAFGLRLSNFSFSAL